MSQTIASVRVFDRYEREFRTFPVGSCGFGYRTSLFKQDAPRYLVLSVAFQFQRGGLGLPVAYAQLADALGVEIGARVPTVDVRAAVLELRAAKGMVLDPSDRDTWSAGSFFTNPVIDGPSANALPADAPRYAQPDGSVKTSAAWLIEHAGFGRGHEGPGGRASLSTKHTLALTNRGTATTADLLSLARELRDGVRERFGVELVPEPNLVGCRL